MTDLIRHRVLHARRRAQGAGGWGWDDWIDSDVLLPVEVRDWVAPGHAEAKFRFNCGADSIQLATGQTGDHVWNWRRWAGTDDLVAVVTDHPEPADRQVLFAGFLADADWQFDRDEDLTLTAAGMTFRLRDQFYLVYGRYMVSTGGAVGLYSGLPCSFNAGGRPNRHATRYAVAGGPARGMAIFTDDDAPGAEWWTVTDALEYLMWGLNAGQAWLANHAFNPGIPALKDDYGDYDASIDPVVQLDIEGLDLWTALSAVADHGRYDVCCRHTSLADEAISSRIVCQRRGTGTVRIVDHQPPAIGGGHAVIDADQTNLFAARIAEATASCVTAPVVAGGRYLFEIGIELGKAWNAADLALPSGPIVIPGLENRNATAPYVQRYVVGGSSFASYAMVGRLWDANTDGLFSGAPYGLSIPDVAALADQTAGSWPAMTYTPRRCLTQITVGSRSAGIESLLEFTIDNGANWYPLKGYKILPGRLGVYLTVANLAGIVPDGGDEIASNLFRRLLDAPASVRMRLTCSIEAPDRVVSAPGRRGTAGTCFAQSAWIDRGAARPTRVRAASSSYASSGLSADTADGSADLETVAAAIQDLNEDRFIEASLPIEWVDPAIQIGDLIGRIGGIEVDLKSNCGPADRYPRVIGRAFLLTANTYQTVLTLDTERQAGAL